MDLAVPAHGASASGLVSRRVGESGGTADDASLQQLREKACSMYMEYLFALCAKDDGRAEALEKQVEEAEDRIMEAIGWEDSGDDDWEPERTTAPVEMSRGLDQSGDW